MHNYYWMELRIYELDGISHWHVKNFKIGAAAGGSLSGPLFTKRLDVLPRDLVKFRSREIGCFNDCVALKIDRHLGSADVPDKFQSGWKSLIPNLAASRLH